MAIEDDSTNTEAGENAIVLISQLNTESVHRPEKANIVVTINGNNAVKKNGPTDQNTLVEGVFSENDNTEKSNDVGGDLKGASKSSQGVIPSIYGRKYKKVRCEGIVESNSEVGEIKFSEQVCGKRKENMEMEVEEILVASEGGKKLKGGTFVASKANTNKVAEVGSDPPREQQ